MEHLDINKVHEHVLAIAKEFDRICTKHNIPYYMLGGTMLGAVRHKGFIPWDDDMDFGVPVEYYDNLEEVLNKELANNFRCCTYRNHPALINNFMKIEDLTTVTDNRVLFPIPLEKQIGINIDIFPLFKCKLNDPVMNKVRFYSMVLGVFVSSKSNPRSIMRKLFKSIVKIMCGGSHVKVNKRLDKVLRRVNKGDCLGNLLGHWKEKEIIPLDWYGNGVRYQFEDTTFVGLDNYKDYLKKLYGNYLELPPEDKRKPHVDNVYLR